MLVAVVLGLGEANCVIRGWRDVACGGPSVFSKKLRMLVLRFAEFWRDVPLLLKAGREGAEEGFLGRDPGILGVSWFVMLCWDVRC